jgi:hypothetical protein
MKESKHIQEPQHHSNDHNGVQDRLDTACHGNEAIHQPQEDANDNQSEYYLKERHAFTFLSLLLDTSTSSPRIAACSAWRGEQVE